MREDDIKINIISDENEDSKEHFNIDDGNNLKNEKSIKDIKDEETNNDEQEKDVNIINNKSINENNNSEKEEKMTNLSKKDKTSFMTSSNFNFNVEESQNYTPGAIYNLDINNNKELHIFPVSLLSSISSLIIASISFHLSISFKDFFVSGSVLIKSLIDICILISSMFLLILLFLSFG